MQAVTLHRQRAERSNGPREASRLTTAALHSSHNPQRVAPGPGVCAPTSSLCAPLWASTGGLEAGAGAVCSAEGDGSAGGMEVTAVAGSPPSPQSQPSWDLPSTSDTDQDRLPLQGGAPGGGAGEVRLSTSEICAMRSRRMEAVARLRA